jgi:hypothetical protein
MRLQPQEELTKEEFLKLSQNIRRQKENGEDNNRKENLTQTINRLANLKIDVQKQSYLNDKNLDQKTVMMMMRLLSPEKEVSKPKSSYNTLKKELLQLRQAIKNKNLSLSNMLSVLPSLESYIEEHEDSINPAQQSLAEQMEEIRALLLVNLCVELKKKVICFMKKMDQFILLIERNTVFDDETLQKSIDTMNANCLEIEKVYIRYFTHDFEFTLLCQEIKERRDKILTFYPVQKGL